MRRITPQEFIRKCSLAENIFSAGMLQAKMDIGNFAVDLFQKSFQAEKVQGGETSSWAPRKKAYPWFIMQKTGNLKASINFLLFCCLSQSEFVAFCILAQTYFSNGY